MKHRQPMLEFAKAVHSAIGTDSPRIFIAVFALMGLFIFAIVWWIVDRGYQNERKALANRNPVGIVVAEPPQMNPPDVTTKPPKARPTPPQNKPENGPRTLKAAVIANTMKDFRNVAFLVENSSTTETFAEELVSALQITNPNARFFGTIVDPPRFAFQGIKVECNESDLSSDDMSGKAADALVRELRDENFIANRMPPRSPTANFVRIVIGDRQ